MVSAGYESLSHHYKVKISLSPTILSPGLSINSFGCTNSNGSLFSCSMDAESLPLSKLSPMEKYQFPIGLSKPDNLTLKTEIQV